MRIIKEWDPGPGWNGAVFSPDLNYYALPHRIGSSFSVRCIADHVEIIRFENDTETEWGHPTFSRDGKLCAGATQSAYEVWSLDPLKRILTVPMPSLDHNHVDFSPDCARFAVCAEDGVRIYDLSRLDYRLLPFAGMPHVGVRFSPDGSKLATWSHRDTHVLIRSATTGEVLADLEHGGTVWNVAWHREGQLLATGCRDLCVHLWDIEKAKRKGVLTEPKAVEVTLDFSPRGDVLMSSGWAGRTHFWDLQTGSLLLRWRGNGIRFARDSDRFARVHSGGGRMTLAIAEFHRGAVTRIADDELNAQETRSVRAAAFLEDGRIIVIARTDGVHLWDSNTGEKLGHLDIGTTFSVLALNDNRALITSHPYGVYRWDINREHKVLRIGPPVPLWRPTQRIPSRVAVLARLSGDRSKIAFIAEEERAVVMGVDDPSRYRYVGLHRLLKFASLNRDGSRLATSTWHGHGVKVWNVERNELLYELDAPAATRTFFTPDDRWLITSDGARNCIWDAANGQMLRRFERTNRPGLPGAIAVSPDGRVLAVMDRQSTVRFYDMDSLEFLADVPTPDQSGIENWGVVFNRDGTRLVQSNGHQRSMFIWDLAAVRAELAAMNLDWDHPPYPPAPPAQDLEPLTLEIDLGDLAPAGNAPVD